MIFQQGPIKVTALCLADQAEIKVELYNLEGMSFSKVIRSSNEEDMSISEVTAFLKDYSPIGVDPLLGMYEEVLWLTPLEPSGDDVLTGGVIATSTHHCMAWDQSSFGVQENSEREVKCALIGAFRYGILN